MIKVFWKLTKKRKIYLKANFLIHTSMIKYDAENKWMKMKKKNNEW